ncbi:histone-fold-containing protein [Cucurbitaria berberidis CBS 394.84]|uniref:DNA polymerase epsilon subunit D n=1 Tax=Cucurbitaria berberidis CBS 394.84 TaxID=1168544 RepID=A0A9P4L3D8_9PLEO|nr:histone-fold-containing protein [Cucurbitaria berberidis CBS 394.84]KAF1840816.1 histone-fold-containing protein [Cucurbitaria berberidis CBS 394.84]
MPARKSNASAVSNEDTPPAKSASKDRDDSLGVEDLNLPKSIVQRLGKGVLPPNTQIQKDALLAMSKSATVFVNYLTSCAAEHAQRSGKRTIMPQDVYAAMTELEFEFMLPRLEAEVTKFTSIQADKRNTYRKKVREEKKTVPSTPSKTANEDGTGEAGVDDTERAAKRARRSSVGDGGVSGEGSDGEEVDEMVDVEDEEVEDDEIEEEVVEEGLTEDPLEERVDKDEDDEDEEMGDGDESD